MSFNLKGYTQYTFFPTMFFLAASASGGVYPEKYVTFNGELVTFNGAVVVDD